MGLIRFTNPCTEHLNGLVMGVGTVSGRWKNVTICLSHVLYDPCPREGDLEVAQFALLGGNPLPSAFGLLISGSSSFPSSPCGVI